MVRSVGDPARGPRQLRVLVVDDNHDAADSLALLIRLWGHEARTAYDGDAGLLTARAFHPDCLLLDIGMPEMDGYTLARRIRLDPDLRRANLIALSAYSSEEHGRLAREAGFDHCLVKPADPVALEGLLDMLYQALKLAERTEALAQKNVRLAEETKELLTEVKDELKEVKDEIREVKEEMEEIRVNRDEASPGESPPGPAGPAAP